MAKYYYAAFIPDGGQFSIFFPDFPPIATCGDNFEDAMDMAEDALREIMKEPEYSGKNAPVPSSLSQVRQATAEFLKSIEHEADGEILYQVVKAPDTDTTPVRINISLPRNVLAALDRKAENAGTTRSGYIARIALS